MNPTNDTVTVRELYKLIDDSKKEIMTTVNRLETKFDSLESGRLTRLERDHADLQAEVSSAQGQVKATSFLVPLAISVFFSVVNLIILFFQLHK